MPTGIWYLTSWGQWIGSIPATSRAECLFGDTRTAGGGCLTAART